MIKKSGRWVILFFLRIKRGEVRIYEKRCDIKQEQATETGGERSREYIIRTGEERDGDIMR